MSEHVKGAFSADEMEQMLESQTLHAAELRRFVLTRRLMHATGGVIQHGPLAGFDIGQHATWRESDNAPKLLGFYEQEVCMLLAQLPRDVLVDLGGADGYYAVGMVARGHHRESHCFEIVDESRANIARIADANGVADRVHLYGAATPSFAADLMARGVDFRHATVLIDIESAEFDVLTAACLHDLRHAHVIVEIHDFMRVHDGAQRYAELIERAQVDFDVSRFTTGARDPSTIPLLQRGWTDTDRWLLCSESRATLMTWLYLKPKEGAD
ncbi:hypothetical protein [Burkholderia alba]|uniref:hypothetical protein n=1 Tax=Burkholderia alba TaxID=2683677 RepID=UPI002B05D6B0|nr:hypothetical protein [Burkholderia alba]